MLFGNDKEIGAEYDRAFVGMTEVHCPLKALVDTRMRLKEELPRRLSDRHKQSLAGLSRATPDWSLLQCGHVAQLPALRWKLGNLETFRDRRPVEFARHVALLDAGLAAHCR